LKAPPSVLVTMWSRNEEEGQGLAEYALILGLIAVVAIVSLIFLGDTVADLMSMIGNTIDQST
jgi:Flp pilus assembly pilin Flp